MTVGTASNLHGDSSRAALGGLVGRIIHLHTEGACIEVDEYGVQDRHMLWGAVTLCDREEGPLLALEAARDTLTLSPAGKNAGIAIPEPLVSGKTGIYFRGLGDFTEVSEAWAETVDEADAIQLRFVAGSGVTLCATENAIAITLIHKTQSDNTGAGARSHPEE